MTCKNCRATIPLLKTRWLCKKDNKRVALTVEPNADRSGVVFGVQSDVPVVNGNAAKRREHDKMTGAGTMSRSGATCPCCGAIMTMEDIRHEGRSGRLGSVMTAVVVDGAAAKDTAPRLRRTSERPTRLKASWNAFTRTSRLDCRRSPLRREAAEEPDEPSPCRVLE